MINKLTFIFLLIFSFNSYGQNYTINGTITGLDNENVYLLKLLGERRKIVDTAQTDATGAFTFRMNENSIPGMYMIINGPGKAVELIFNNEDIQFTTSGFESSDGIQIISSVENLIYYDYLGIKGLSLYKIDVLNAFLQKYPANDKFYNQAVIKYNSLKNQLNYRIEKLVSENPDTYASRYIKSDRPVIPDPLLSADLQNEYLKAHHFDNVDFNDTLLIHSTILTSKVVGYLSLNQKDASSQEQLEDLMLESVDSVLFRAQENQQVYEFVVDFLVSGFESIGFERGLTHIANSTSLDQFCENTERKKELENKLELIRKLAIGQPAPEFSTTDINGNIVDLYEIDANKTVLIFWASWCPHCDEIMPVIDNNLDGNTQVIAISIDENKDDLMESIKNSKYDWINIAELKGWNGDIVEDYGIAATPSIFILDKDKKIIAKPLSKDELKSILTD